MILFIIVLIAFQGINQIWIFYFDFSTSLSLLFLIHSSDDDSLFSPLTIRRPLFLLFLLRSINYDDTRSLSSSLLVSINNDTLSLIFLLFTQSSVFHLVR
ncbi:Hypothetical predicted protein [Prunus dulcis]|uniref:Uncharacterized protein n=1 Tax=Prunus dulcis TaxID=3755 RepID=A0A5E4FSM8_PRUDU|nr:Hypothetical predicted protein [Prunus dulcis]